MEKRERFNIESLAEDENTFLREAKQNYGVYYEACTEVINYTNNFIEGIDKEVYQLFSAFWGSVTTNLTISMFALLRKHQNLSHIVLRHVCEGLILAAYSLTNPDYSEFIKIDDNGNPVENSKALRNANKWFKKNFSELSDKIKLLKDLINSRHAHSNYGNVASLIRYDSKEKEVEVSFFDVLEPGFYIGGLVGLSKITYDCIEVIYTVNLKYSRIKIDSNYLISMKKYYLLFKENLKNHDNCK